MTNEKSNKKRKVGVGIVCLLILCGIGAAVGGVLYIQNKNTSQEKPNQPSIPTIGDINFTTEILNQISQQTNLNQLQKIIDKNEFEKFNELNHDITLILEKILNNSIVVELTNKTPDEYNNLLPGIYAKIKLNKPNGTITFDEHKNPDSTKYFITSDFRTAYIHLYEDNQLEYFKKVVISNLTNAFNALVNVVEGTNRFTTEKFDSTFKKQPDIFLNPFCDNLISKESNNNINFKTLIMSSHSSFNNLNGQITLQLKGIKKNSKDITTERIKYALGNNENHTNIKLNNENKTLIIQNLRLFDELKINFDKYIKQKIQSYIDDSSREYSLTEFQQAIQTDEYKKFLSKLLNITFENIDNLKLNEKEELIISLKEVEHLNYVIDQNTLPDGVSIVDSNNIINPQIKITKFDFWEEIDLTITNSLRNNIRDLIEKPNNEYTLTQFRALLNTTIKEKILENIKGIKKENILDIDIDSYNNLTFELNPLKSRYRYNVINNDVDNVANKEMINGGIITQKIIISNIDYFKEYDITNLNNSLLNFKNEILNVERCTKKEFEQKFDKLIPSFYNLLKFKNTENNQNETVDFLVGTPTFDNNKNEIIIKLNRNLKKYKISESVNNVVMLNANKTEIIIKTANFDFYEATTYTIKSTLTSELNKLIEDPQKLYTKEEFLEIPETIKQKVAANITNLDVTQINRFYIENEKLVVELSLKDNNTQGNYHKHLFVNENNGSVLSRTNSNGNLELLISGLNFYRNLTEELNANNALLKLWQDVNKYIINNDVRVSNNSNDDQFKNHQNAILNIVKNCQLANGGTLGDFIATSDPITRNLANLTFNLDKNKLNVQMKNNQLFKFENLCLDQGYIEIDSENYTLSLNNLYLGNPDSYFSWEGSNKITGLAPGHEQDTDILIPKTAQSIGYRAFYDLKYRNIKNMIICDTVSTLETEVFFNMVKLTNLYVKTSRNIVDFPKYTFTSNYNDPKMTRNIHIYNGKLTSTTDQSPLSNIQSIGNYNNGKEWILPPSLKKFSGGAIDYQIKDPNIDKCTVDTLTIWGNSIGAQQGYRYSITTALTFNFLADSLSWISDQAFRQYDNNNLKKFTINVKNNAVKNKIINSIKDPDIKKQLIINIDSTLSEKYKADKYCPIHGIHK